MSAISTNESPLRTGPLAAALTSVILGLMALLFAHQGSTQSKWIENEIYSLGKWIPGAVGSGANGSIGPYSGKEMVALGVWLISWIILHMVWKGRTVEVDALLKKFLVALSLITLLFLHPLADPLFSAIASVLGGN